MSNDSANKCLQDSSANTKADQGDLVLASLRRHSSVAFGASTKNAPHRDEGTHPPTVIETPLICKYCPAFSEPSTRPSTSGSTLVTTRPSSWNASDMGDERLKPLSALESSTTNVFQSSLPPILGCSDTEEDASSRLKQRRKLALYQNVVPSAGRSRQMTPPRSLTWQKVASNNGNPDALTNIGVRHETPQQGTEPEETATPSGPQTTDLTCPSFCDEKARRDQWSLDPQSRFVLSPQDAEMRQQPSGPVETVDLVEEALYTDSDGESDGDFETAHARAEGSQTPKLTDTVKMDHGEMGGGIVRLPNRPLTPVLRDCFTRLETRRSADDFSPASSSNPLATRSGNVSMGEQDDDSAAVHHPHPSSEYQNKAASTGTQVSTVAAATDVRDFAIAASAPSPSGPPRATDDCHFANEQQSVELQPLSSTAHPCRSEEGHASRSQQTSAECERVEGARGETAGMETASSHDVTAPVTADDRPLEQVYDGDVDGEDEDCEELEVAASVGLTPTGASMIRRPATHVRPRGSAHRQRGGVRAYGSRRPVQQPELDESESDFVRREITSGITRRRAGPGRPTRLVMDDVSSGLEMALSPRTKARLVGRAAALVQAESWHYPPADERRLGSVSSQWVRSQALAGPITLTSTPSDTPTSSSSGLMMHPDAWKASHRPERDAKWPRLRSTSPQKEPNDVNGDGSPHEESTLPSPRGISQSPPKRSETGRPMSLEGSQSGRPHSPLAASTLALRQTLSSQMTLAACPDTGPNSVELHGSNNEQGAESRGERAQSHEVSPPQTQTALSAESPSGARSPFPEGTTTGDDPARFGSRSQGPGSGTSYAQDTTSLPQLNTELPSRPRTTSNPHSAQPSPSAASPRTIRMAELARFPFRNRGNSRFSWARVRGGSIGSMLGLNISSQRQRSRSDDLLRQGRTVRQSRFLEHVPERMDCPGYERLSLPNGLQPETWRMAIRPQAFRRRSFDASLPRSRDHR